MKPAPFRTDNAPGAARTVTRFELAPRTIVIFAAVVFSVWILYQLVPVLLVLVAALMIVGALNPIIAWLEKHRVRRLGAIGLVFVLGLGLIALGLFVTVPALLAQVKSLVEHEPEIRGRIVDYLENSPFTQALADRLRNLQYDELLKNSQAWVVSASMRAATIVTYGLAAIFLALYLMIDRDRWRGALFALIPRDNHVQTSRVLINLETIVGGYIRGQVITCALSAAFIFILLQCCNVPNALALATFGGLMDLLPYIGAFLTILPAVGAALSVGPGVALAVLLLLLAYQEFENRILLPVVYGRVLRLPSSMVFFSLLVGGTLGGIAGALLALPIAAAVLMLLDELRVELPGEAAQPADFAAREEDAREAQEYKARTEDAPAAEAAAIAVQIARDRQREETEVTTKN